MAKQISHYSNDLAKFTKTLKTYNVKKFKKIPTKYDERAVSPVGQYISNENIRQEVTQSTLDAHVRPKQPSSTPGNYRKRKKTKSKTPKHSDEIMTMIRSLNGPDLHDDYHRQMLSGSISPGGDLLATMIGDSIFGPSTPTPRTPSQLGVRSDSALSFVQNHSTSLGPFEIGIESNNFLISLEDEVQFNLKQQFMPPERKLKMIEKRIGQLREENKYQSIIDLRIMAKALASMV
jgi:hypothetical protein